MYSALLPQPVLTLLSNDDQHVLVQSWSKAANVDIRHHRNVDTLITCACAASAPLVLTSWDTGKHEAAKRLLEQIRGALDTTTRLVVLGENNSENDVVTALDMGADRYITSDTSVQVFDAHINAVMRRLYPHPDIQHYPPYTLYSKTRKVLWDDDGVQLTPMEFRLVRYVFENENRVLSRKVLLRNIWELPELNNSRRVDTTLCRIRQKILLNGAHGWQLAHHRGQGYELCRESS